MKNRIEELFRENFGHNEFKLVDRDHPLSIYIGRDSDGNYAMEYVGFFEPHNIASSKAIGIAHYKTGGGRHSVVFSLLEVSMLGIFCAFCTDLVESTKDVDDGSNGYQLLINRYYSWKELFLKKGEALDKNTIKGLIGELLFLRDHMMPEYGKEKAILSWMGPEKTKKDFSLDNTWYEVKTISSGKDVVRISSFEQLDSDQDGELVIYQLEDMSPEYDGLKLNAIVREILKLLDIESLRDQFLSKLVLAGYAFESSCDRYVFELTACDEYLVTEDFPCLRRHPKIEAIAQASYDLSIGQLSPFKIK